MAKNFHLSAVEDILHAIETFEGNLRKFIYSELWGFAFPQHVTQYPPVKMKNAILSASGGSLDAAKKLNEMLPTPGAIMSPDDALKIVNSTNGARYWAIWKIQAFINHMSEMLEKEKREASAKGELNAQD